MELLFNLLSLYYVYRSVRLAVELWQQRQRLRVEPLSRWQVHAGEQAAFFLAVPVAVAVHELGHAVAIWAYGGEVVQFAYRFFWGYVLPRGSFTLEERWIIAVAGTAGSLLAGLAIWGAGHLSRSSALRYFGRRALRLQIFFSLIYYPVFSAIGLFGDWVTI